jgi:hypothetical protein
MRRSCCTNAGSTLHIRRFGHGWPSSARGTQPTYGSASPAPAACGTRTKRSGIAGTQVYFWQAVDGDGQSLDVLFQEHRDTEAAERFFRRFLGRTNGPPAATVTGGFAGYGPPRLAHPRSRPSNAYAGKPLRGGTTALSVRTCPPAYGN